MSQFDILLSDAQTKTQNFQQVNSTMNKGVTIPKNEILELLNQGSCIGIRVYFALNSRDQPNALTVILSAIQDNGTGDFRQAIDIISLDTTSTGKLKDNAVPCPPGCNAFF